MQAGRVCLGPGAGLIRGDLRDARGTDVIARSGGLLVAVRGRRPRTVPVLSRYHAPLLAAARSAGAGLICGGADPGRRNLTNPLVTALDGGSGLPRLDTSRLRAAWLRDCADLLGLATFMTAAGISCSQRLGDLIADLDVGLVHGGSGWSVREGLRGAAQAEPWHAPGCGPRSASPAALVSFGLLAMALKRLEVGPAYAAWTGLAAACTAVVGIWALQESLSPLKLVSIGLIRAGVIGLNLSGATPP